MKKISFFDLHSMQNLEFSQFSIEISKLIMLYTASRLGIVNLEPAFQSALEQLAKALQAEKGSVYTKTITQSDAFRDQLEHGFFCLLNPACIITILLCRLPASIFSVSSTSMAICAACHIIKKVLLLPIAMPNC